MYIFLHVGCLAGGFIAFFKGAKGTAGLLGGVAVPGTFLSGHIAKTLLDYMAAFDKLAEKRIEYNEISESLLTNVKKTVEIELKESAQLLN